MENSKTYLAQKCSLLYYENQMQQNEIAKVLGISRAYVSRLLTYALEENLVKIRVVLSDVGRLDPRMELEMSQRFPKLKKAFVLKSSDDQYTNANIGMFTVQNIVEYFQNAKTIGLSLGVAVEKSINALTADSSMWLSKKKLVQMMGNLPLHTSAWAQPHELISALTKKINGEAYFLNSPVYIEQEELCKMLYAEESIACVCEQWRCIDIALMGIEDSRVSSKLYPLLNEQGRKEIERYKAVGNITAVYFDQDGQYVPVMERNRIGVSYEELMAIENKIVIGVGPSKVKALKAALTGGLIDILVTDSLTCELLYKD